MRIKKDRVPVYRKRDDYKHVPRKNYSYADALMPTAEHNTADAIEARVVAGLAKQKKGPQ